MLRNHHEKNAIQLWLLLRRTRTIKASSGVLSSNCLPLCSCCRWWRPVQVLVVRRVPGDNTVSWDIFSICTHISSTPPTHTHTHTSCLHHSVFNHCSVPSRKQGRCGATVGGVFCMTHSYQHIQNYGLNNLETSGHSALSCINQQPHQCVWTGVKGQQENFLLCDSIRILLFHFIEVPQRETGLTPRWSFWSVPVRPAAPAPGLLAQRAVIELEPPPQHLEAHAHLPYIRPLKEMMFLMLFLQVLSA